MDILRKLVPVFLFAGCFVFLITKDNNGVEAFHVEHIALQNVSATQVEDTHRTKYHFQPPKHWINDPNGPMFYKGIYHLFYQYNPLGSVWGNIVWAHSISKDLINWEALPHAIFPSKKFDDNGTWSGSATILPGNRVVILYTGVVQPDKTQMQSYAIPKDDSDPYLREWEKPDDNPLVMATPDMNATNFRDPTTGWWHKGHWRMLVGGKRKHRGMAWLYRSIDFKYWVRAKHPLHSAPDTGMWECPDFFPVPLNGARDGLDTSRVGDDVKHVFKVSLDETRYEYYTVGMYDPDEENYMPDNTSVDGRAGLRFDYGNFYASKTFYDPSKNRRILWGWANESDSKDDDVKKGWAGIQAIPRELWLSKDGKQVMQWPVEELDTLRGQKVDLNIQNMAQGKLVEVKGITAAQADVDVTFSIANLDKAEEFDPNWEKLDAQSVCGLKRSYNPGGVGPFGLVTLASQNLEEFTPVFFRVFKTKDNKHKVLMCSDAKSSTVRPFDNEQYRPSYGGYVDIDLAAEKKISLRSLIDHSVVESFAAGGKTCILSRVYPTLAVKDATHLFVFNNGTEPITVQMLNAWSMNAPKHMNQNMNF